MRMTTLILLSLTLAISHTPAHAQVVVVNGDSLSTGYGSFRLTNALNAISPGYIKHLEAAGGMTAQKFLDSQYLADTLTHQPDVIALMLGVNNVAWSNDDPATWFDGSYVPTMTQLLDLYATSTNARGRQTHVILMTVTPIIEPNAYAVKDHRTVDYVNPWLTTQADTRDNVTLLDVRAELTALPDWQDFLALDGLHMWADGAAGYYWLADLVADKVHAVVQALPPSPGDFNGDDAVDSTDLALLLDNWGAALPPTGWMGQWDGNVDANELAALLGHWGEGVEASGGTVVAVPAPAPLLLLLAFSRRIKKAPATVSRRG